MESLDGLNEKSKFVLKKSPQEVKQLYAGISIRY
jgi:hypothetical protein